MFSLLNLVFERKLFSEWLLLFNFMQNIRNYHRSISKIYICLHNYSHIIYVFIALDKTNNVMSGLPRFTGSLRAFSGVKNTNQEDPYVQRQLNEELKWRKNQKSSSNWSWGDIEKLVSKSNDPIKVFIKYETN